MKAKHNWNTRWEGRVGLRKFSRMCSVILYARSLLCAVALGARSTRLFFAQFSSFTVYTVYTQTFVCGCVYVFVPRVCTLVFFSLKHECNLNYLYMTNFATYYNKVIWFILPHFAIFTLSYCFKTLPLCTSFHYAWHGSLYEACTRE